MKQDPVAAIRPYLKTKFDPGTAPPPRPAHDWFDKMYDKLFSPTPNLYNTMTADAFEKQSVFLLAMLQGEADRAAGKPKKGQAGGARGPVYTAAAPGGDSDPTNARDWPKWFNKMQGLLIWQTNWVWLQEECSRLLYMYACWHLASGAQENSKYVDPPSITKQAVTVDDDAPTADDDGTADGTDSTINGMTAIQYIVGLNDGTIKPDGTGDAPSPDATPPETPAYSQIPLIVLAAENEVPPDGAATPPATAATGTTPAPDPAPARAYRPDPSTATTVKPTDRPKLPLNLEHLFRYIGKSHANYKAAQNFQYAEPTLNTEITQIGELGHGTGNWCGPASFSPFKNTLAKHYVFLGGFDANPSNWWAFGSRMLFKRLSTAATKPDGGASATPPEWPPVQKAKSMNLTDSGDVKQIDEMDVDRGDIIVMINHVGPLSGHVATVIRSQDASGDKCKVPAMVTWISGNAGGPQGGSVRIQTVWRVKTPEDYNYSVISAAGNNRDEKRVALDKDLKATGAGSATNSGDTLNTSKVDAKDPNAAQQAEMKDLTVADAKVKDTADRFSGVRPDTAGEHWLMELFKVSKFDLPTMIYGPGSVVVQDELNKWLANRPKDARGKIPETAPSADETTSFNSVNTAINPKYMYWAPPGSDKNSLIVKLSGQANAAAPRWTKNRDFGGPK